ncbi:MAG: hypothetical protein ACI9WU_004939 [Myxococcota bacterium]|jgi:hypothetical protein
MFRTLSIALALCVFSATAWSSPAQARIPDAATVLKRTVVWARALPAKDIPYSVLVAGKRVDVVWAANRTWPRAPAALKSPAIGWLTRFLAGPSLALLQEPGVDTAVTSLFHLNRRVVVIVGAKAGIPGKAQVWFDRESGRVMRIVLPVPEGKQDTLTLRGPFPPYLDFDGAGGRRFTAEPRPTGRL